jgi:hypothetical protein
VSDIFEMGIGISFPEGEYTEEQFKDISEAVMQLQGRLSSLGASVSPAVDSLVYSAEGVSSSMAASLDAISAEGFAASFGQKLMGSMADAIAGTDVLQDHFMDLDAALSSLPDSSDALAEALQSIGTSIEGIPGSLDDLSMAGESLEIAMLEVGQAITEVGDAADYATDRLGPFDRAIRMISAEMAELKEHSPGITKAFEGFGGAPAMGDLASTMRDLEHNSHTMAVGLGMAGERAQYMRTEMLQLGATTQFSIGEITRLSQQLHRTGRGLDEFGVGAQQNMIALNDIFQVSGEDISRTERTVASFGGSLTDTLDDAAKFQKQFQVPGLFQSLPQVVDHAQQSVVQFGTAVVGSGQKVMGNVTKTAGVFAKGFGKTMAEAINDAQSAFDRFATVAKTSRRVFLGLESDFDPLQKAFMEVGVPLWQSSKIIEGATSDSETAVLGFVDATRSKLKQLEGSPMGERFLEQLRDELPPAVFEAVTSVERYRQLQEAATESQRRQQLASAAGTEAFEDLSNEMLNTTQELQKMWFNVKQLIGATLVQTGVMDGLKSAFGAAKDVFAAFASNVESFIRSEGFQAWAERIKPVVKVVGAGILTIGTAFGSLAGAVGSLMAGRKGLKMFGDALDGLTYKTGRMASAVKAKGPLGSGLKFMSSILTKASGAWHGLGGVISGVFTKIGPKLLKGIPVIGTVISAVDAVVTAFKDMGDVISDPTATGMEKFSAILRGTLKGVVTFFDNILLGIPGFIAGIFFPDMEKTFDEGFAGLLQSVSDFDLLDALSSAWDSTVSWLGSSLNSLGDWLLNDFGKMVGGLGKSVGGIIGGLVRSVLDLGWYALKQGLTLWPRMIMGLFDWIFSEGVSEGAESGFDKAKPGILEGAGKILAGLASGLVDWWIGLADGMLQPFNLSMGKVWYGLKAGGLEFIEAIVGKFTWFTTMAVEMGKAMMGSWEAAWGGIKLAAWTVIDSMIGGLIGSNGFITILISGVKKAFGLLASLPGDIGNTFAGFAKSAEDTEAKLATLRKETAAQIETEKQHVAEQTDLAGKLAAAREKAAAAEITATGGITDARKKAQSQYDSAESNLQNQLDFNKAVKDHKVGLEKVLSVREEGDRDAAAYKQLNSQAAAQAQDTYRDYIAETISSLSEGVSKGALTAEQAIQRLADAKVKGVKDAIAGAQRAQDEATGTTAGDVSKSALGDPGQFGVTPQMLKGLMVALNKGALERGKAVTVTLRGSDAITKEMAKKSAMSRLKNGNP